MIKFRANTDDGTIEEIITYNQIIDKLEVEDGEEDEWHFRSIINHKGPLKPNHDDYKRSREQFAFGRDHLIFLRFP